VTLQRWTCGSAGSIYIGENPEVVAHPWSHGRVSGNALPARYIDTCVELFDAANGQNISSEFIAATATNAVSACRGPSAGNAPNGSPNVTSVTEPR
jgi:hypothetical protein